MKKIQFFFFALVLSATTLTFTSCGDDDPCKDVVCGTNGECFEGSCVCNVGYETDAAGQCNVESRAKFTGSYTGAETCTVGTDNYTIGVANSSASVDKVVLTNVYNQGVTLTATVNKNALTIPATVVSVAGLNYTFAGSGTYTAGTPPTLAITYSITGTPSNSCTFTGSKL